MYAPFEDFHTRFVVQQGPRHGLTIELFNMGMEALWKVGPRQAGSEYVRNDVAGYERRFYLEEFAQCCEIPTQPRAVAPPR